MFVCLSVSACSMVTSSATGVRRDIPAQSEGCVGHDGVAPHSRAWLAVQPGAAGATQQPKAVYLHGEVKRRRRRNGIGGRAGVGVGGALEWYVNCEEDFGAPEVGVADNPVIVQSCRRRCENRALRACHVHSDSIVPLV